MLELRNGLATWATSSVFFQEVSLAISSPVGSSEGLAGGPAEGRAGPPARSLFPPAMKPGLLLFVKTMTSLYSSDVVLFVSGLLLCWECVEVISLGVTLLKRSRKL